MEYDKDIYGNSLEVEWIGSIEEKREALAHKMMDAKEEQEYIYKINKENRKKVAESNKAPF